MRNKKGFTLVEVILMILLIGILLTSALTSYFSSAKTFNFLEAYKSVMTPIRTARGYALANKDGATIQKYGVRLKEDCVSFMQLEAGDDPFELENHDCKGYTEDEKATFPTFLNHEMTIDFGGDEDYEIALPDEYEEELNLYLLYETGSGNLTAYHDVSAGDGNQTLVSKTSEEGKDVWISVSDANDPDLEQYIVILTVSGLAEESKSLPLAEAVEADI